MEDDPDINWKHRYFKLQIDFAEALAILEAKIAALEENIELLIIENQALRKENLELREKLNTNSNNSSKPPSQDPFRAPRKRQPTGRKQGAQPGHPGYSRKLVPIEEVNKLLEVKPSACPDCQSVIFDSDVISTEVRQVIELPETPPEVTQYNIHTCRCSQCGKHVKAEIPNEAKYGFGPRLMGLITCLSGEFRLSKRQVTALMGKIGIKVCSGSVCKIHERAAMILQAPYEEIKEHTLKAFHLNADETSWKTLSEKKWCWIGAGQDSEFFQITHSRSAEAFQQVFGTFNGVLTTDRYNGYNTHDGGRQLCWAHADRDFEKIASRDGFDQWLGERLKESKSEIFDLWHQFKDGKLTRENMIEKMERGVKEQTRALLKAGAACEECSNKTRATCLDFSERFDCLWLFIYQEGIEPTNNRAERGLRHGVIWRKLSYGSQSEIGQFFVERVMTVAATLRLRAKNTFEYFTACFKAYIYGAQSPPIPA